MTISIARASTRLFLLILALGSFTLTAPQAHAGGPVGAPQNVTATATADTATVTWTAPATHLLGYRVSWSTGTTAPQSTRVTTTTATISGLAPDTTYTISVAAYDRAGRLGRSATATVRTAGPAHVASAYALDIATGSIVSVPLTGGPPTVVAPDMAKAAELIATSRGLIVRRGREVLLVSGSTTTALYTSAAAISDVDVDAAGNVYALTSDGIVRVAADGSTTTLSQPATAMAVSPSGVVYAGTQVSSGSSYSFTQLGGASRTVTTGGYLREMAADDAGNLFLRVDATGGSGFGAWYALSATGTTTTKLYTHMAEYLANDNVSAGMPIGETVSICFANSEDRGTCTVDRSVPTIITWSGTGAQVSSVSVSGLVRRRHAVAPLAVAQDGTIVAATTSATPALVTYPAAGGEPIVLATGTFDLVTVG